jgi:hypothetical protein
MIEAVRRPATRPQEGLSGGGGVEMDAEGFIRPSYSAAGGASKAPHSGEFHV